MKTTALKGTYHPALTIQFAFQPGTPDPVTGAAKCKSEYLGVVDEDDDKVYMWSPFVSEEPNALLNPGSISVSVNSDPPIEGAVISARLTAAGVEMELNAHLLNGDPENDSLTVEFSPDDSWPKLSGFMEPRPGALMIPFPSEWA